MGLGIIKGWIFHAATEREDVNCASADLHFNSVLNPTLNSRFLRAPNSKLCRFYAKSVSVRITIVLLVNRQEKEASNPEQKKEK